MRVFFIRHAESTFNVWKKSLPDDEKRCHPLMGHRNCGITSEGEKQCLAVRDRILEQEKTLDFDAVVVSPLRRTQETFQRIGVQSVKRPVVTNSLCREFAIDECDFFQDEEVVMETREHFEQRLQDFKTWLKEEYSGCEKVAVISHGDFIHAMLANSAFVESSEDSKHWLDNAEYTVLNW